MWILKLSDLGWKIKKLLLFYNNDFWTNKCGFIFRLDLGSVWRCGWGWVVKACESVTRKSFTNPRHCRHGRTWSYEQNNIHSEESSDDTSGRLSWSQKSRVNCNVHKGCLRVKVYEALSRPGVATSLSRAEIEHLYEWTQFGSILL